MKEEGGTEVTLPNLLQPIGHKCKWGKKGKKESLPRTGLVRGDRISYIYSASCVFCRAVCEAVTPAASSGEQHLRTRFACLPDPEQPPGSTSAVTCLPAGRS